MRDGPNADRTLVRRNIPKTRAVKIPINQMINSVRVMVLKIILFICSTPFSFCINVFEKNENRTKIEQK